MLCPTFSVMSRIMAAFFPRSSLFTRAGSITSKQRWLFSKRLSTVRQKKMSS